MKDTRLCWKNALRFIAELKELEMMCVKAFSQTLLKK